MSREPRRARILVVDDSNFDRQMVCDALERHLGDGALATELEIECCENAEQALAALAREPVDLVLSDLNMPGLGGLQLLDRVNREYPGVEFVLLTGNASVDSAILALRKRAFDYLRKPVQPEELAHVVQRTLTQRWLLAENARLREAVGRLRLLRETADACHALARCLEAGEVYPRALRILLDTLERRRALGVFHRSSETVSDGVVFRGFEEEEATELRRLLIDEKCVEIDGASEIELQAAGPVVDALRRVGVEPGPVLAVPVSGADHEAGVLWVLGEDEPFRGQADLERAQIIAEHTGLALSNAERYSQAKERAFIDDVTELYNARYLYEAAQREIQRAERYGSQLSVLFLDLDRFKLVNDQHGHLVGSRALRQLGRVLEQCVRQVDTLSRYGGDEFTILLVDTALDEAMCVAERIRGVVEAHLFEGARDGALRLTVSIGVAAYPEHGRSREQLLDFADKAMYRAKSIGRNRVCSATDLDL